MRKDKPKNETAPSKPKKGAEQIPLTDKSKIIYSRKERGAIKRPKRKKTWIALPLKGGRGEGEKQTLLGGRTSKKRRNNDCSLLGRRETLKGSVINPSGGGKGGEGEKIDRISE